MGASVTNECPSYVVVSLLHYNQLLWNQWTNFDQILQELPISPYLVPCQNYRNCWANCSQTIVKWTLDQVLLQQNVLPFLKTQNFAKKTLKTFYWNCCANWDQTIFQPNIQSADNSFDVASEWTSSNTL